MPGSSFGTSGFGTATFSVDNFYDGKKLIDAVMRATSQALTDSDARARTLEYTNARYLQILKTKHWNFLERRIFIDLLEPETTGTISTTEGLQAITGSGTAFASTHVNQKIIVGTDTAAYEINTVTNSTSLSLFNKYADDSQSAVTFKILFNKYQLPQDIQNIRSLVINGIHEMVPIGPQEMHLKTQSNPGMTGTPRWYTLTEVEPDSGQWYLEVYPSPDQRFAVTIDYNCRPAPITDDVDCFALIPDWHMDVLYYGVLADTYRYLENSEGYTTARADFMQSYNKMISDNQLTDSQMVIVPARNYWNRSRRKFRGFYGTKWFGRVDD